VKLVLKVRKVKLVLKVSTVKKVRKALQDTMV